MDSNIQEKKQAGRKENRQISIRVSDELYEKLQENANTLGLTVAGLIKQKAEKTRLINPRINKKQGLEIIRILSNMSNNLNQITKQTNIVVQKDGCITKKQASTTLDLLFQQKAELKALRNDIRS